MTRAELEAEAQRCQDEINRAYWAFTRTKRGKPPVLVCPEAYRRLREVRGAMSVKKRKAEHVGMPIEPAENLQQRIQVERSAILEKLRGRFGEAQTALFVLEQELMAHLGDGERSAVYRLRVELGNVENRVRRDLG